MASRDGDRSFRPCSFRPLTTRPNLFAGVGMGVGEGESEGGEDELKGDGL
jgi:hypothetical protein